MGYIRISKKDAIRLGIHIQGKTNLEKIIEREEENISEEGDFFMPKKKAKKRSKKGKWGAQKTVVDGKTFDSKKEAAYYQELKTRKKAGDIVDFDLQPKFILQEGFRDKKGKHHRAITYTADFTIYHHDGAAEVVDVKGSKRTITPVYRLKKKLLLKKFPSINFREEI